MKYILIAVAFCFSVSTISAQEVYSSSGKPLTQVKKDRERKAKPHGFEPNRIVFGGGFGLGIGAVTNISVSPIIGYRFTDKFTAGIGLGYQYIRAKEGAVVYDPSTAEQIYKPVTATCYFPSVWARYTIWRNIFAHAEYQHNFLTIKDYYNDFSNNSAIVKRTSTVNEPTLWLGAGIKQPISERVSFVIIGLYDVIPDKYNLYNGPIDIRFGINAGF
jgi:hypothetical protein